MSVEHRPENVCGHRVLYRPPLFFSTVKRLMRARVRGSYRLLSALSAGNVVEYDLGRSFKFTVPLFRGDNCWDLEEILSYEHHLVSEMLRRANEMNSATFVDCGADIGTFSVLMRRGAATIERIIAIEANIDVLPFLKRNLGALPLTSLIVGAAAGNSSGVGRLQASEVDDSDHARFLVNDTLGDILVMTIDSFGIKNDLILKIDVEGGEYAVLEGAAQTIRRVPKCLICFEAHSEVTRRTGRDPLEMLLFLNKLRTFEFLAATPEGIQAVDLDRAVFDPSDSERKIWNIIAFAST